jgi:putative spermidine/putrescine transport system ATP-binding protein
MIADSNSTGVVSPPAEGSARSNGDRAVALRIEKLSKRYPGAKDWSVKEFSLSVGRGDLVALLGPSGCGKTTTLRMLAGLVDPTAGEIWTLSNIPAHRRNIGLVFQHYALFHAPERF